MAVTFPMTVGGHNTLKAELSRLRKFDRLEVVAEIEVARAHGDLKENAEYHAAKERQGMIEARVKQIEQRLSHAQVINPSSLDGDRVLFGAHVTIFLVEEQEQVTYQIVGDDEADIKEFKICYASPIARALIGKEEGDEVIILSLIHI